MLKINLDLAKTGGPYGRLSEEMRKITFHFPEIHEVHTFYPLAYHPSIVPFVNGEYTSRIMSDVISSYVLEYLDHHLDNFNYNLCVDLGANIGIFTLIASKLFRRVVAFEADPHTYNYAQAIINYNGLCSNVSLSDDKESTQYLFKAQRQSEGEESNIELHNLACASKTGQVVSLYSAPDDLGSNMIYKTNDKLEETQRKCMTIDFSTMQELLGTKDIDYLKVDIEGSEYDFLLEQDLSDIKVIRLELHSSGDRDDTNHQKTLLINQLIDQGFWLCNLSTPYDNWDNIMACNGHFISLERHEEMWQIYMKKGRFA